MSLEVSVRHAFPGFPLAVDFNTPGGLTALFGPSGCGKTSIVNVIAGLLRPEHARIVVEDDVLADTARNIWLPPHLRRVGYIFQDARLLPHLSVRGNLRYGRWFTARHRRFTAEDDVIALLGLETLLERRPRQLSGGEKQRVAIGRALLQSPRLLLMDEPLASLDGARKQEILPFIERLRDETRLPIVYVSHAIAEVTRLASHVVLLEKGHVVDAGPLPQVMHTLSGFEGEMAREAGSIIAAEVLRYDASDDLTMLSSEAGEIRLAGNIGAAHARFRLHVRSSDVTIATSRPKGLSAINILEGTVDSITEDGAAALVALRCGRSLLHARITRYSVKALHLRRGQQVFAIIKAMSVRPPIGEPGP